jgi:hypothetical protein
MPVQPLKYGTKVDGYQAEPEAALPEAQEAAGRAALHLKGCLRLPPLRSCLRLKERQAGLQAEASRGRAASGS